MNTEPTPPLAAVDQPRLVLRLREACSGHPAAKIPWPHRILHEAADRIETFETAARALVDAWDEDEIGQIDGELIDAMRKFLPENSGVSSATKT